MSFPCTDRSVNVRVFITRDAWEGSLRHQLVEPGRFSWGTVRWRREAHAEEVLCDHLETTSDLPNGAAFPPFDDWLVLVVEDEQTAVPNAWVDRIAPKQSQRLVVVVLSRREAGRWDAVLYDRGRCVPVDLLVIAGSGMLTMRRDPLEVAPSDERARLRSSRTAGALGSEVHDRLSRSCATVVGAGRLGSLLAFHLAGMSIGRLRLIDPDRLGWENLDAMPGLTEDDIGRPKVAALAERLLAFRSDLLVSYLAKTVTDPEAMRLVRQRTDLLVTCVDSDTPRMAVSLIGKETLTAHLDIGTHVVNVQQGKLIHADVRLLMPDRDGGCIACVGGLGNVEETLYELSAPPGVLRRGEPIDWRQQRAGSLLTINSVAVGVGVQMWLDLLAGDLRTSYWHRLRWVPGGSMQVDGGPVGRSEDCRFCMGP
jgi:hypothetical protein